MKHNVRILTLNLCYEYPDKKINILKKWIKILSDIKGDIIFLQEIYSYNIEKLASELGLKILNIDNIESTSVLINPNKLMIDTNNSVTIVGSKKLPIYIGNIHLDDIPSVPYHINHLVYSNKIPLSYTLDKIIQLCAIHRLPRIKKEIIKTKQFKKAIIGGDFNEPSHLDTEYNKFKLPVSIEFKKHNFIDTFHYINPDELGYTWPAGILYKNKTPQRIDMIYTKGIKIIESKIFCNVPKWMSDHKMVITDIVL